MQGYARQIVPYESSETPNAYGIWPGAGILVDNQVYMYWYPFIYSLLISHEGRHQQRTRGLGILSLRLWKRSFGRR